uniref:Uncharacterized protein n=1 Tax=Desulfovibrio sp. U5L TaxID=596152 RepID=I2Q096_9BACT
MMEHWRKSAAAAALAALLGMTVPVWPQAAEAGPPAPLPTQIPIRDVSAPPTPGTPARAFTPKPAHRPHKRKRPARRPVRHPVPRPAPGQKAVRPAGNPATPKLEQRFEAPTESIFPLGPEPAPAGAPAAVANPGGKPAPAEFPPEPAPAPKPAISPAPQAPAAAAPGPAK